MHTKRYTLYVRLKKTATCFGT